MEVRLYILYIYIFCIYYIPLKTLVLSTFPFLQLSLEISNDIPRYAGKDILWKQIILLRVVNGRP